MSDAETAEQRHLRTCRRVLCPFCAERLTFAQRVQRAERDQ